MLGIEDYGSDAESSDEGLNTTSKATATTQNPAASTSSLASKLPPPASKSTFALPPPKTSLSLSEPSSSRSTVSKHKRTKKINLLSLQPPENDEDDGPPAKKPRVTSNTSAGKSSLLSMLPAPKKTVPVIEKKEERVLGGGGGPGLVFRASKSEARQHVTAGIASEGANSVAGDAQVEEPADVSGPSTSFVPASLKKGKANISLEDQGPSIPSASSAPAVASTSSFSLSSAPTVSTFRPPSPTLDDAYPGYYQLPSGAYAPYDANYYASYARKWKEKYDKYIRELEKAQHEPDADGAQDVDMAAEMEKARREIKEREDWKALTTGNAGKNENGEQSMPRMNVKGAKLGSVARSRHQLTTLLTEAYLNREALEEKIAQGRRNRKEAGMKYGF